jgi:hypothetical protein
MVTLVNNHVLFSLMADRKVQPEWSRTGQSDVVAAVTAAESRRAMRVMPRVRLSFLISPRNLAEQIELDNCVMAASKSGLAAAPYHGRSSSISSVASTSVVLNNNFSWAVGDYLFLRSASGFEVRLLTSAILTSDLWTLGFTGALTGDYSAGNLAWPLLFGEFATEEMEALSPQYGPVKIAITELISARTVQVGELVAPGGSGIGSMIIGETFIVA